MISNNQTKVYNDGLCRFCVWGQKKLEGLDTNKRLEFLDLNDSKNLMDSPYSLDEHKLKIVVQTPGGKWVSGYWGIVEIFLVIPRWQALAWIMGRPPLSWVGPISYRIFARYRYSLPDIFFKILGTPRPCSSDSCQIY